MNRLTLKFFATLRERMRTAELRREFPEGMTVGEIWDGLVREIPALGAQDERIAFAVNHEYVNRNYRPADNDEDAFIQPVSGGVDARWVGAITISHQTNTVTQLEQEVGDAGAGGIGTFAGNTRCRNVGRRVLRLEYEAY